ncbi:2-C-methyl-D-erythritol 2,4-cyclodiphosphate synthase [Kaarinaea lacus]
MRIGHGYDAHRFDGEAGADKFIMLGGVKIPFDYYFLAHSDGDVVVHAVCDALLGAAALGDIGHHFPDTSSEFVDIDSRILLRRVVDVLAKNQFVVGNIDVTIVAQEPKMAPHISDMCHNIASDLGVDVTSVSVKATTTEKMGFTGRGEGIACHAVALILPAS